MNKMRRHILSRLLAQVLVFSLVLSLFGGLQVSAATEEGFNGNSSSVGQIDPDAVDPDAVDPDAVDPDAVDPNAVDPDAVDPDAVDPNAVDPDAVDPDAVDPDAVDPNAVDPNAVDPNAVDPNEADLQQAASAEIGTFAALDSGGYFNDFENGNDQAGNGAGNWYQTKNGFGAAGSYAVVSIEDNAEYSEGKALKMKLTSNNFPVYTMDWPSAHAFTFTARMRTTSASAQSTGFEVVHRAKEKTSSTITQWADISVKTGGTAMYEWQPDGGTERYPTIGFTPKTLNKGDWYTFSYSLSSDDILSVYIDGEKVGTENIDVKTLANYVELPDAGYFGFRSNPANREIEIDWVAIGEYTTGDTGLPDDVTIDNTNVADVEISDINPTATFSVAVTGDSDKALSYRWQRRVKGAGDWLEIAGATSDSYTLPGDINEAANGGDEYRCAIVVTDKTTARTKLQYSDEATLTFATPGTAPEFTTQPADTVAILGETATFTAEASVLSSPSDPVTYRWEVSTNNGSTWTTIAGATADTYTTEATTAYALNGNKYRVIARANNNSVTSQAALLMVQKDDWSSGNTFYTTFADGQPQLIGGWTAITSKGNVPSDIAVVDDPSAFGDKALRLKCVGATGRIYNTNLPSGITDGEYAMRVKGSRPTESQGTQEVRFGQLFRVSSATDFQEMSRSGTVWYGENQSGGANLSTSPDGTFSPGQWHTLRTVIYGNRVTVWFDGVKVVDNVANTAYTTDAGGVFGIRSWFADQDMYFDNIYVGPVRSELPPEFAVDKPAAEAFNYTPDYSTDDVEFMRADTYARYNDAEYDVTAGALKIDFNDNTTLAVIDEKSSYTKNLSFVAQIKSKPDSIARYRYDDIALDDNASEETKEMLSTFNTTGDFGIAFRHQSSLAYAILYYDASTREWTLRDGNNLSIVRASFGRGPILKEDEWYTVRLRANERALKLWVTDDEGEHLVGSVTANNSSYPVVAGRAGFVSGKEAKVLYIKDFKQLIYEGVQRPNPEPPLEAITIASSDMSVVMDNRFPVPREYTLTTDSSKKLIGYDDFGYKLDINGEEWLATVQGTPTSTANSVTYTVRAFEDITAPSDYIDFKFAYKVEGKYLSCEVTVLTENGNAKLYNFEMSSIYMAKFTGGDSSKNAGIKVSGFINPGTWNNTKDFFSDLNDGSAGSTMFSIGFIHDGTVAAGVWNDSADTPKRAVVDINDEDKTDPDNQIPKEMMLNNGSWTYRGAANSIEFPNAEADFPGESIKFTVFVTGDNNGDSTADWQDAANLFREVCEVPEGGKDIRDFFTYVSFNFNSITQNPFLRGLDDAKKLYNYTDGFGQMILEKGYQAEGHDDSHPDVGKHIGIRQGGSEDFNTLIEEGHKFNIKTGVHVNVGEYILDAFFNPPLRYFYGAENPGGYPNKGGWGWLDQAFYLDQTKDLVSGELTRRFDMLEADAPELDMVYVDIYSAADWRARKVSDVLNRNWMNFTEFSGPMEQNVVWTHWGTDLYYPTSGDGSKIFRFIYNDTKDAFPTSSVAVSQLLRGSNQPGIGGWQGRTSIKEGVEVFFNQNLPSKYMQYFPVSSWNEANTEIVFGAPKNENWQAVPSKAGAKVKTTSTSTTGAGGSKTGYGIEIYAPDGHIVAVMSPPADTSATDLKFTRKEQSEMFIPWDPIKEDKIYYWQGKTTGGKTSWQFPASWGSGLNNASVQVYKLTDTGRELVTTGFTVLGSTFTPGSLSRQTPYVIYKAGVTPDESAGDFGATNFAKDQSLGSNSAPGNLADPGFDTHKFVGEAGATEAAWSKTGAGATGVTMTQDTRWNGIMTVAASSGAATVTNTIKNLKVGKTYAASIWYQVGSGGTSPTREMALSVTNADGSSTYNSKVFNRSVVQNWDEPGKWKRKDTVGTAAYSPYPFMSRIEVKFTADSDTAIFKLDIADGAHAIVFDDARIWECPDDDGIYKSETGYKNTTNPKIQTAYYYEDFENVSENWGPFVYARTDGGNQTHLVEKAPATYNGEITSQHETYVLQGDTSLKIYDKKEDSNKNPVEIATIVRTTPTMVEFKAGKKYEVEFKYNVNNSNYFIEVRNGSGTVIGTRQTLTATNTAADTQRNPDRQQTKTLSFTAADDNTYIAIGCTGNPGAIHTAGLVIDDFAVYEENAGAKAELAKLTAAAVTGVTVSVDDSKATVEAAIVTKAKAVAGFDSTNYNVTFAATGTPNTSAAASISVPGKFTVTHKTTGANTATNVADVPIAVTVSSLPHTANLTGIALSGSPTGFTFAPGTYTYEGVGVANNVASITVTPTGAAGQTITVNGTAVASGSASGTISLTVGVEETITVLVTESGKTDRTYTIKVTRAAPSTAISVTVAAGTYSVTKAYDGSTSAGIASGSLSVDGILPVDSGVTVTATPQAYSASDAGSYTVTVNLALSGDTAGKYALASSTVSVPGTITKKAVTVTADNKTVKQGGELPPATVSYSGFLGSDSSANALTTPAVAKLNVVDSNTTGTSVIDFLTQAVLNSSIGNNYTLTHQNGTLTVSPLNTDCEVSTISSPSNATIGLTSITATVASGVSSQLISLTISADATWKLFSDVDCITEIADKTMILSSGANTAYIKVTAEDGTTTKVYVITITRLEGGSGGNNTTSNNNNGSRSTPPPAPIISPLNDKNEDTINTAINSAVKATTKDAGTINTILKNVSVMTKEDVGAIVKKAAEFGKKTMISSDVMSEDGKYVEVRVTLNPELITGNVRLDGYVRQSQVMQTTSIFNKYFENKFAVISLGQEKAFGQSAKISAKVDLKDFNKAALFIYSYDKKANKYTLITNRDYRIDKNGYLVFNTNFGGDIIVSNGKLARK